MPNSIYHVIWIFLIYAFIGWCSEVVYAAVSEGKFSNRGFLIGPVCPIYGFGMLIVLASLWSLRGNVILLFLGATVLTTLLEFLTGFVLERFFHEKWWDYSDIPFNIKGYVCLKFSLLWGLAASFAVGAVHTFIDYIVIKMPFVLGIVLLSVFMAIFLTDLVITLYQLLKLPKKLYAMEELEKLLRNISDSIGENISETTIAAKEKGNEFIEEKKPQFEEKKAQFEEKKAEYEKKIAEYRKLAESKNFVHKRIISAFPNLKKGRYKAVFDRLSSIRLHKSERKNDEKDSV